jgi:hypothetical protein
VLEESRARFFTRTFDAYGLILSEEERTRELELISRKIFEYTDKHQPNTILLYGADGALMKTSKYKKARYLQSFRTPGL